MNYKTLSGLGLSLLVAACGQNVSEDESVTETSSITISGSAAYRERIALPPDATVVVTLEDVSRADAPADTVAEATFETEGRQVPIPFSLSVDPDELDERARYSVRVRILDADGNPMWTTDTATLVPATPETDAVDVGMLRLVSVDRTPATEADVSSRVTGVEWVVDTIGGREVVDSGSATITLGEDGTIAGQAPCNRYTGSYELDGTSFNTDEIAVTSRACVEKVAVQEVEFLAILRSAKELSVNDEGVMALSTPGGESIVARRAE